MRPLKLTISAFGSYAEKQEILFDENKENLFLITGDTGAGKTTIFDAICFAFYGEMSGENREGKMMRSDYALPEQKTYVEFIFEDKGKKYKIIRNPEYFRKSKKKKKREDGSLEYNFVKETAKAELFFLDEENNFDSKDYQEKELSERSFVGNLREVNAKIIEIIGLDQGQFTRIAMIAQNEFMKLLVSPTEQRKEIFQKLFHTQKYHQIVKIMGERKKEKESILAKNRTECEMILQESDCIENSEYKENFENYKENYFLHQEEFLEILELIIKEEETRISFVTQELIEQREESDHLLVEIHKIEEVNQLFHKLSLAESLKEKWEKEALEIEKKEELLEKADRAEKVEGKKAVFEEAEKKKTKKETEIIKKTKEREKTERECQENKHILILAEKEKEEKEEILKQEIVEIEKNLPGYDEIEKIRADRKKQERKQKKFCQEIEELYQGIQKQEEEFSVLSQRELEIEELIKELPEKTMQFLQTRELLSQYKELKKEIEKIKELSEKKTESEQSLNKMQKEFRKKSSFYEEMLIHFTNGQAGLMAEKLRTGEEKACPVCGNIHYIKLAPLESDIPTQEQVKKAKKKRDELEEKLQELSEIAGQDRLSYEKQYHFCQEKCRELTNGDIELKEDAKDLMELSEMILTLEKKKNSIEKEKRKLEQMEKEQKEIKEKREEMNKEIEKEKKLWQERKEERGVVEQELSKLQAGEEIYKKSLMYESRKEADVNLKEKKEVWKRIMDNYKERKEKQELLEQKLLQKTTEEETMQKELKALALETEEKRKFYEQIREAQGFLSEKEWLLARAEEKQKKKWKQEIEQTKKEVISARQAVIELKKQLEGKEIVEEREKKLLLEKKKEQIEELSKEEQREEFRKKRNEEAWKKLKERKDNREKIEQEYRDIKNLYEVANGTLAGSVKVDLETFVQRQYLKQVLKAANRRFLTMSNGQFELRLKEGTQFDQRSNQGLDLCVYSLLTNSNRDIKTLSGGESFMAALSMALGMADMIQSMAGGIKLHILFIDEGFGALDDLSRQQAVNVLQELSDGKRMIGIISHVTELKEQVNRKLIVEKTEKGSRAYWE